MRPLIVARGGPRRVRLVAGADVAYDMRRERLFSAVLVYSFPDMVLRESRLILAPIRFPYVPGLLSFREAPALVRAFDRLQARPDLLLCDGQGIAHPRGIGLASHLGLLLGVPTIGCAKSRLVGSHEPVGPRAGDRAPLEVDGRTVGWVLRTRAGVRPVYVSPGHLIGRAAAARWVLECCRGFRLPEPVRQADLFVGRARDSGSGDSPRDETGAQTPL
jgi:deoxyribonuclease V